MTTISIPFDTLHMVDRLVDAGVPTAQAKVQIELLAEVIRAEDASIADRFSSKQGVAEEILSIKVALEKLESKFDSKFDIINSKFDAVDSKFDAVDSKFDAVDSKISASAAEVKSELIRWVVSVGIVQITVAGLLLKLIH